MSDDIEGWKAVGEFEEATRPDYEEADVFTQSVLEDVDDTRTVDVFGDGDTYLEHEVVNGERWVPIAEITTENPHMYAHDVLSDVLVDSPTYRAVAVHGDGPYIEKLVMDDD